MDVQYAGNRLPTCRSTESTRLPTAEREIRVRWLIWAMLRC